MKKEKIVLVFGTFDGLHPGHRYFLKEARQLGDRLLVVVARDVNVKLLKGRQARYGEEERRRRLLELSDVDEARLGRKSISYEIINEVEPDVIALGYDQKVNIEKIKRIYSGELRRLKAHKPQIYKSSKINPTTNSQTQT